MQYSKTQNPQPQTFSMKELRNNALRQKQERLALAKQHADALARLEQEHRKSCARDFGNVVGGAAGKVGERVAYCYLITRGPVCCLLAILAIFGLITRSHDIMQQGMHTSISLKPAAAPVVFKSGPESAVTVQEPLPQQQTVQEPEPAEAMADNHCCPYCQSDLGNEELPKLSGIGKHESDGQERWYGFCPDCGSFLGFSLDRGVFLTKLNGKALVAGEVQNLAAQLKSELKKIGRARFKKKYGIN